MDKYEERRLNLIKLVDGMGRGGAARVAEAIGKSPAYVSRMLYPKDKAGHKGIGENSADLLDKSFPGWMGAPMEEKKPAKEPRFTFFGKTQEWPFSTISPAEWDRIPTSMRDMLEIQIKAVVPVAYRETKTEKIHV